MGWRTVARAAAEDAMGWVRRTVLWVGVLLVLGLGTRILAIGYVIDMFVATRWVRIGMGKSPFSGGQGIGWEFEFILAVAALALLFTGAGSLALDPVLGL